MTMYGGIYYNDDGISTSIRAMHLQTALMNNIGDNVNNFGKIGYQRKIPVLSSFSEYIGANALSEVKDTAVGRLKLTRNPLDLALASEGYFQYQTPQGIKLTRDGRFKLDKNGYLLTLENYKVLSSTGQPIRLKKAPASPEDVKIDKDGTVNVVDRDNNELYSAGQISVVSNKGSIQNDVSVRQGYTEDSNVSLNTEFLNVMPVRRNFEANRQLYILQNDELSKTIQSLGSQSS